MSVTVMAPVPPAKKPEPSTTSWTFIIATLAIACSMGLLYRHVIAKLVHDWTYDGNYSHGFFIVPLSIYFVWERRARLAKAAIRPSWLGVLLLAGGILVLLAGLLGSELFLSRVSIIITLTGIVLFLFGWQYLRLLAFPLAFLILMIPIPAIIWNQIALPLQLFASRVGVAAISAVNIPVLREGNVIVLANATLEVAEACSGIRSLVSLITLGIVFGYFADRRVWARSTLVAMTIPIAIFTNGARVAATGISAHLLGPQAAEGFFHEFSGWIVFTLAFLMVLGVQWLIAKVAPDSTTAEPEPPAVTVR